jgi:hypothetical protein
MRTRSALGIPRVPRQAERVNRDNVTPALRSQVCRTLETSIPTLFGLFAYV